MNAFPGSIHANVFLDTSTFSTKLTEWETPDYKRIVFAKLDAIAYTLDTYNEPVGYIDTDMIVFKDPTPIVLSALETTPVVCQCDEKSPTCSNRCGCPGICSGLIVFKSNLGCFSYKQSDMVHFLSDQQFLNSEFTRLGIPYTTIEKDVFLNGTFPGLKQRRITVPETASVLHFNYLVGNQKKNLMQFQNMWY
jgi:hypothetical protein